MIDGSSGIFSPGEKRLRALFVISTYRATARPPHANERNRMIPGEIEIPRFCHRLCGLCQRRFRKSL